MNTFADFVQAVVAGKSVQPTFDDGLQNEKVLSAIVESAKTRQWVKGTPGVRRDEKTQGRSMVRFST